LKIKAVVDRIEGEMAILLLEKKSILWPLKALPRGCREGDIISIDLRIDKGATLKRSREISSFIEKLSEEEKRSS